MPLALQILPKRFSHLAPSLRRLLKLLHIAAGNWSITIVRDAEMAALHARTMNLPTTTDVLTFDLRDPPRRNLKSQISNLKFREGSPLDLDTVICVDEARRRAKELGHAVGDELLLYALHSLLHVQGYDDTTPAQFKRMHAREDELLAKIGIGPVYEKPKTQNAKSKARSSHRNSKLENRKSGGAR
jgi:probable rRNA maturation factor